MRNVSDKILEEIETFVIYSTIFFPENRAFYEIMSEKYGTDKQTTDNNIL